MDIKDLKQFLNFEDTLTNIESDNIEPPWITVYEWSKIEITDDSYGPIRYKRGRYCALIPNEKVTDILSGYSWDVYISTGMPVYDIETTEDDHEIYYERYCGFGELEPLVYLIDYHGAAESKLEVSEEFRHFHKLFLDEKENRYINFDDNGDVNEVILLEPEKIKIKIKELNEFLVIKNLRFCLFYDDVRDSSLTPQEANVNTGSTDKSSADTKLNVVIGDISYGPYNTISRLLGKRILPVISLADTEMGPFRPAEEYQSFIIGVNEKGINTEFSCDPSELSDYFGANLGNPHFLTPVYFRRDVLSKYYENNKLYSVTDGIISKKGAWRLQVDNNHKDFVIVFLGYLGREITSTERLYWKNFNIPPGKGLSNTGFSRSFLGQFSDPEMLDLVFKETLQEFTTKWYQKNKWHLFKPLSKDDEHFLVSLRMPLNSTQREFDNQVIAMEKILVECINVSEINKNINLEELSSEAGSIIKLEAYFGSLKVPNTSTHIEYLKELYNLRTGIAHIKSDRYYKALEYFHSSTESLPILFSVIMERAISLLKDVLNYLE